MTANISKITPYLWTGGDLSFDPLTATGQVVDILGQGITHIIDMRGEDNDHDVWNKTPVKYTWLGTKDEEGWVIPDEIWDAGVAFARKAYERGGRVLAHCHMGVNRGPSMAFAILLDSEYRTPVEAYNMVRASRDVAALEYAEQALAAHHLRRIREGRLGFDRKAEMEALRARRIADMTESTVSHINGYIDRQMVKNQHEWLGTLQP